jgi:NAD(P)-dependent dehydrogenase (short-subunit alcohol dehydrogenase family)
MKTVLITGASSGLGRVTAEKLAGLGYNVFGTSRRSGQSVQGVTMLVMDVQDETSVTEAVQTVVKRTGRLDVLINNAGVLITGAAEETTLEQTKDLFETNFFGALRTINAVLPVMRQQGEGRIINVASMAGRIGVPGEAAYSASKFALVGYSEALRHEVAPFGIHVSLVEPGFFQTNMEHATVHAEKTLGDYKAIRSALETAIKHNFEKGSDPKEVATLVAQMIQTPKPRLHYLVGGGTRIAQLKNFMPEAMFETGLKRNFGLDKISSQSKVSKELA